MPTSYHGARERNVFFSLSIFSFSFFLLTNGKEEKKTLTFFFLFFSLSLSKQKTTGRCPVFLGSKADVDEAEACLAADPEHLQARK